MEGSETDLASNLARHDCECELRIDCDVWSLLVLMRRGVVMERLEVELVGADETALMALRLISAGNSAADCFNFAVTDDQLAAMCQSQMLHFSRQAMIANGG